VALLTALALALRLPTLGSQSLSGDEQLTAWHMHQSLGNLLSTVPNFEALPYLHFLLLKVWTQFFGSSAAALRSLSVVAGVATVPVTALVARELFSRRAALLAALLVATNPLLAWYSQEARPYALLVLLAALALLFFARAVRELRPRNVALWAVWSALALLTHYFALFWIVPQAAWLLLLEHRAPGRRRAVVVAVTVLVLECVALFPLADHQRSVPGINAGGIAGVPLSHRVQHIPREYLLGPSLPCLSHLGTPCSGGTPSFALAAVLVLVTLIPLVGVRGRRFRRGVAIAGLVGACAVLVPLLLAVGGIDFVTVRNVISGVVPFLLVVAAAAATDWRAALAALALSAIGVVAILAVFANPGLQRNDWRGLARRAARPSVERAIVASPGQPPGPFNVYWPRSSQMRETDRARVREVIIFDINLVVAGTPPPVHPPGVPPAFHLVQQVRESDYTLLRYRAAQPQPVSFSSLVSVSLNGSNAGIYLQR
jgi:4-amino-4-deoxy-L-arabinose transferase-like glycosyltransferase